MKSPHQLHELRSLRMHRIVEELYRETPSDVIRFGLENLKRWQQRGVDCDDFRIWEEILRFVPQRLPEILSGSNEEAVRLRQSSPFAGLIPEASRQQILTTSL
jgi:hypothetical protein